MTVLDAYGRLEWQKDEGGFLTYTQYDVVTGAVTKAIADVDTTHTSDFTDLPTGWSTPSGGGLHLITTDETDGLGRVTKETSPAGRVDYFVYDDPGHAVRYYPGWDATWQEELAWLASRSSLKWRRSLLLLVKNSASTLRRSFRSRSIQRRSAR